MFNRKDDMQPQWVSRAFGVRAPRLQERFVPSSEAYVRAALMGWGIGVVPELQVRGLLDSGALVALRPEIGLEVRLFWHQWRLGPDGAAPSARVALLDRIGDAWSPGPSRHSTRRAETPQRAGRSMTIAAKRARSGKPASSPASRMALSSAASSVAQVSARIDTWFTATSMTCNAGDSIGSR